MTSDLVELNFTFVALAAGSSAKGKDSDASEEVGYEDIPGFCKSATLDETAEHGYVLTPGRYVGAEEVEVDGVPFAEKMATLPVNSPTNSANPPSSKKPSARI